MKARASYPCEHLRLLRKTEYILEKASGVGHQRFQNQGLSRQVLLVDTFANFPAKIMPPLRKVLWFNTSLAWT
jgi:hypothetical protein